MSSKDLESPDRRNVIAGLAVGALAASVASTASAQASNRGSDELTDIVETAMDCIAAGEICMHHAMLLFANADTSMADCAHQVTDSIAICRALATLAAHNSRALREVVQVSIPINEACEQECLRHADQHAECQAMADACAACLRACRNYLA